MGVDVLRRVAQSAVIAIYVAAWAVSLWTIAARGENHYHVTWDLTAVFLLTMGICSVPDLIALYKAVVLSRVKQNGANQTPPEATK